MHKFAVGQKLYIGKTQTSISKGWGPVFMTVTKIHGNGMVSGTCTLGFNYYFHPDDGVTVYEVISQKKNKRK